MVDLTIEDLTFTYPGASKAALRGISLAIPSGGFICLCGKSGCGKTTLLRSLKSVLAPHGVRMGHVLFGGTPLEEVSEREQSSLIGFVMQEPEAQIVTDKVWHELAFGLESLGIESSIIRRRVAEMACFFGLEDWFHRDVSSLSGGQKQWLNLASIMVMEPRVLILDEPTGQLDPMAATDFLSLVRRINDELGVTIIMAEHRLEEVYGLADEVVVMEAGSIVAHGTPRVVADALYGMDDPMAYALPAPIRIFHGVTGTIQEAEDAADAPSSPSQQKPLRDANPLTVREGREWLKGWLEEHPPARTALPVGALPKPQGDCALSMKDIWFCYEREDPDILKGVDLTVPQGMLYALCGANGAGKTTLLKCASGVVKPYRGQVRLFGKRLKDYGGDALYRGCVAMLPQNPTRLFVKRTVRAELEEMLKDLGLDAQEREQRLQEVVELCQIPWLLDSHPFDLSGGEQQRVALAKVLLTEPRLLLLDEPTKGIDSLFKRELAQLFDRLKQRGATIVMASHDIEFCAQVADGVSLLFDGSIIAADTARGFFAQNSFYTTAANRMSRGMLVNAVTDEDVIGLCRDHR